MDSQTVGVLLMNLGGPDGPESVRPFLYNLFSDRLIIRLGPSFMQKPLAWLIARRRAPKSAGYYARIGGGSPLLEITRRQASALEARLREHGDFQCFVGMRYWHPFIEDTVREMHDSGIRRLLVLSLYPHYSIATTGSSMSSLVSAIKRYPMDSITVEPWYQHPGYVDSLAEVIRDGLRDGTEVLFSAHGLPRSFIEGGDPYVEHIMGTIHALESKLPAMSWRLGYQSRSGPVKWLEPSTEEVIKRAAEEGVRDLLVVPISFISDHIETLYEIDLYYKEIAGGLGVELRRTESLNTRPRFIYSLGEMVLEKARGKGWA
jgi:ferrochelatase